MVVVAAAWAVACGGAPLPARAPMTPVAQGPVALPPADVSALGARLCDDLLEIVDLDKGTSAQAWLPCDGESRAQPAQHRFMTRCGAETILTTVTDAAPAFSSPPPGTSVDALGWNELFNMQYACMPDDPRFSRSVIDGVALLKGSSMRISDGELLDARTFAAKEHYLLGQGSLLHVRDDGTYETNGDARSLENTLVCTDGRRFGPTSTCARPTSTRSVP